MGIYTVKHFVKEKGNWVQITNNFEKLPHTPEAWRRNSERELKSNKGERTKYFYQVRGSKLVVGRAVTYFGDKERFDFNLITTSSSLPKKYQ